MNNPASGKERDIHHWKMKTSSLTKRTESYFNLCGATWNIYTDCPHVDVASWIWGGSSMYDASSPTGSSNVQWSNQGWPVHLISHLSLECHSRGQSKSTNLVIMIWGPCTTSIVLFIAEMWRLGPNTRISTSQIFKIDEMRNFTPKNLAGREMDP